ncbi:hypothetical protein [Tenacibaculum jejuense]|uniref:Uncharacterized protein n=1 Tax=Tenacibaculum jejuense TaxID=584609 RepID=A0A238UC08_9FLAO|nr:hypothetical protein [Tenacibaculum jejuense]SNR16108.1 Protein of unknown function [Tenacibaculum jejuense]
MNTPCKEMSIENYIDILNNNPELKEKLSDIGILENNNGEAIIKLKYYDLLTKKEKDYLNKSFKNLNREKYTLKYGIVKGGFLTCLTDEICDNCHKALTDARNDYK